MFWCILRDFMKLGVEPSPHVFLLGDPQTNIEFKQSGNYPIIVLAVFFLGGQAGILVWWVDVKQSGNYLKGTHLACFFSDI